MGTVRGNAVRPRPLIVWGARVLASMFIVFVSLFALDVFDERHSVGETLVGLVVHLIPSGILVAGLVAAWHRPRIGALVYGVLGAAYIVFTLQRDLPAVPLSTRLLWCAAIAGPALVVAGLFWLSGKRVA